ncbi:hypothetical protein ACWEOG_01765 [Amycolatopsis japonica]
MSRKNRNPRTPPATDTTNVIDDDRHLHAVADAPGQQDTPTTEDKVREALTTNPGATTAALGLAAGVGRSTAAKILARWGRDGTAIRTTGDGPRDPGTWSLAPAAPDTDAPGTEDTRPDTTASDTIDGDATANEPASDADDTPEAAATDTTNDEAGEAAASDVENVTSPLPRHEQGDPGDSATGNGPSAAKSPADTEPTVKEKDRLPKGGLKALVEEYLSDHPSDSFGPAKIGKDLGRSGGAVNNALEKLVADGYARKTCEAPKRFTINPEKTDVSAASDNTEPALNA